jgi:hypothetical protein
MTTNYSPIQTLIFLYNRTNKILYVRSNIIVRIKPNEYLQKYNVPDLASHAATIIQYHVIADGQPKPTFEELIPLLTNVFPDPNNEVDDLRAKIVTDMQTKMISRYAVTVSINRAEDDGETTTTISSDGTIDIVD